MKYIHYLLFSFFIKIVFGVQTFQQYESIKSDNSYVIFESKNFAEGESMYFTIKTDDYCDDYLYYEYYDEIEKIEYIEPTYYVKKHSEEKTKVNGRITSVKMHFTIEKKKAEIGNDINGNYLLLYYDCGQFKIENTKNAGNLVTIIIVVSIIAVVLIFFIVFYCYRRRVRQMRGMADSNYVAPYGSYYPQPMYPGMPNNPMIYQRPAPNYGNYSNFSNYGNSVNIHNGVNGVMPNAQPPSQRIMISNKLEKPKKENIIDINVNK
jgi:hypothetical protein